MSWHYLQGGGGGILAAGLLGLHTVCAVEIEPSAREMLLARQRDGVLPRFPIWDDVQSFDGRPWRGLVDVISGGFPCQDISVAGRGAGIEGERSGLWREMFRIVCEVRPRFVFVENSPLLVSRGLSVVLGDLASAGYDACWCVLGADDVGAPHVRKRFWLLAHDSHADGMQCAEYDLQHSGTGELAGCGPDGLDAGRAVVDADGAGWDEEQYEAGESGEALGAPPEQQSGRAGGGAGVAADADVSGCKEQWWGFADEEEYAAAECCGWWGAEPALGRVAHGVADRVDRLRALGNGQVPLVAAVAFKVLERYLMGK
ncbi:MAG: DNA cytosine methyltransferase [Akkermansia sp.]|nr:DNA cytosine methyltransferase [Akkermansia sp.]